MKEKQKDQKSKLLYGKELSHPKLSRVLDLDLTEAEIYMLNHVRWSKKMTNKISVVLGVLRMRPKENGKIKIPSTFLTGTKGKNFGGQSIGGSLLMSLQILGYLESVGNRGGYIFRADKLVGNEEQKIKEIQLYEKLSSFVTKIFSARKKKNNDIEIKDNENFDIEGPETTDTDINKSKKSDSSIVGGVQREMVFDFDPEEPFQKELSEFKRLMTKRSQEVMDIFNKNYKNDNSENVYKKTGTTPVEKMDHIIMLLNNLITDNSLLMEGITKYFSLEEKLNYHQKVLDNYNLKLNNE